MLNGQPNIIIPFVIVTRSYGNGNGYLAGFNILWNSDLMNRRGWTLVTLFATEQRDCALPSSRHKERLDTGEGRNQDGCVEGECQ